MKKFTDSMQAVQKYISGKSEKSSSINEWLKNNEFSRILESYIEHGDGGLGEDKSKWEKGDQEDAVTTGKTITFKQALDYVNTIWDEADVKKISEAIAGLYKDRIEYLVIIGAPSDKIETTRIDENHENADGKPKTRFD
jgi:hypothetical protein